MARDLQPNKKAPSGVLRRERTPETVPAIVRQVLNAPGERLDGHTRDFFEPRFGHDFSRVRVHTDVKAAESAAAVNALAYTAGRDVVFGPGAYLPATMAGKELIAHELSHVLQQGDRGERNAVAEGALEIDGKHEASADSIARTVVSREPTGISQESPAAVPHDPQTTPVRLKKKPDVVKQHETWWGNLKEEDLGGELAGKALEGDYDAVQRALDGLGMLDRDDVSCAFMETLKEPEIDRIVAVPEGRLLLDRVYDELTSGSVGGDELTQAKRVLAARTRRLDPKNFAAGVQAAKVFPFRLPGLTVLDDAPIEARRIGKGRIWVHQPVRVLGTRKYRNETKTLPPALFSGHIELAEDEIVGVKLYDQGGVTQYWPALYLLQLSNETETTIGQKIAEAGGIGLSLGAGTLVGAAKGATWGARAVFWGDRVAAVLGVVSTLVQEHRGWLISTFPDGGPELVDYFEKVSTLVAVYGMGRATVAAGQVFVEGIRRALPKVQSAYQKIKSTLTEPETGLFGKINAEMNSLLKQVDELAASIPEGGMQPSAGAVGGGGGMDIPMNAMSVGRPREPKPKRLWPTTVEDLRPKPPPASPKGASVPNAKAAASVGYPEAWLDEIEKLNRRFPKLRNAFLRPKRRGIGSPGTAEEAMATGHEFSFRARLCDGGELELDDITAEGKVIDNKYRNILGEEEVAPGSLFDQGPSDSAPGSFLSREEGLWSEREKMREVVGLGGGRRPRSGRGQILEDLSEAKRHDMAMQLERQSLFIAENELPDGEWLASNDRVREVIEELIGEFGISNIVVRLVR